MNSNEGGAGVVVWWTPDCGYLHVETDPVTIPTRCPDDVMPDEPEA